MKLKGMYGIMASYEVDGPTIFCDSDIGFFLDGESRHCLVSGSMNFELFFCIFWRFSESSVLGV